MDVGRVKWGVNCSCWRQADDRSSSLFAFRSGQNRPERAGECLPSATSPGHFQGLSNQPCQSMEAAGDGLVLVYARVQCVFVCVCVWNQRED